MKIYSPQKIEPKWQQIWQKKKVYKTPKTTDRKNKLYCLDMFPYPSGEGLHVGHPRGYTATDVYSRYMRQRGKAVLHPMGWDAFGLPAENYAIKKKIHPRLAVEKNVRRFKKQIQSFGYSYDWEKEINTTDPAYYHWTQWIFLKLYQRGLVYQKEAPINWCPSCKTGLANEEVVNGHCERCKTKVEMKKIRQIMLKITAYADKLLDGLEQLDWSEAIKTMQRNWIGKSQGVEIDFKLASSREKLTVFTTRPDTLYGASYVVIAPDHAILASLKKQIKNWQTVERYIQQVTRHPSGDHNKTKSGLKLEGIKAINPVNQDYLPVYVADYVSVDYATGAIMAVPAHDQRDWEFAKKFNLPIIQVIQGGNIMDQAWEGNGKLINSGIYSGLDNRIAGQKITAELIKNGQAKEKTYYKLRDWIFSRQRYWGEPIPLIHCDRCGIVPVPEKDLPVRLPEVKKYRPSGTGESPLAAITDWVNTTCPKCGGPAKRETNTMPQWAGSCWYYLRYLDPKNKKMFLGKKASQTWLPVDIYVGGAEHAVLHLLYARFWHRVLYDEGLVATPEPFQKLINVGIILADDGQKMSKSRGNVINPDELIQKYGADSLRLYELFLGPFSQSVRWKKDGILGTYRFLLKVWEMQKYVVKKPSSKIENELNRLIFQLARDIEKFRFNTAIAKLMSWVNLVHKLKSVTRSQFKQFLILLSIFSPHIAEELWHSLGEKGLVVQQKYPQVKKIKPVQNLVLPIQINGKLRGELKIVTDWRKDKILKLARQKKNVQKYLVGKKIVKTIYIPLKIINFVVR